MASALRQWAPAVMFCLPPPPRRGVNKLLTVPKAKGQLLFRTASGAPPKVAPETKKRVRNAVKSPPKHPKPNKRARPVPNPASTSSKSADKQADNGVQVINLDNSEAVPTVDLTVEECVEKPKKPLWPIFQKGYVAPGTPSKRARPSNSMLTTSKSGQRLFKTTTEKAPAPKAGAAWQGGGGGGRRYHMACHRVPGTGFVVDSFRVPKQQNDATQHFLTHMHSDHYGGLTKTSMPDGAKVLCSPTTAALASKILGLQQRHFWVLPVGVPVDVPCASAPGRGATVWLYDANHCPGAVLLLFRVWATSEWVLHCGDCRFDVGLFSKHAELARVMGERRLGSLYLDTTYASEKHDFPLQKQVLDDVAQAAETEDRRTGGRAVFFCGSYTIGKERVVATVAKALGEDVRVFAESRKRGILRASDLGPEFEGRITENARAARVFVVPMGKLSPDGVREFVKRNKMDETVLGRALAVCVRPTGWSYRPGAKAVRRSCRAADNAVVLDVAYSEHSSLGELRQFVQWARPRRVVPTVGFHGREKREELFRVLGHKQEF